ncbi:Stk31 [Gossypium arboreum]|uniref:Stk31 n=1 Tax=Gossypium arboreum TaxID=29729 RepID=A0A0B0Q085_GOSAR|nr:Stk31 [Gossypium arboreum]
MACRGCLECLLKLLNFLVTVAGLAIVRYGIYLFVKYKDAADTVMLFSPVGSDQDLIQLGRPMLMAVSLSSSIFDNLPKACFNGFFFQDPPDAWWWGLLVLTLDDSCKIAFIFFDKSWKDEIPTDKTGDFDLIYEFLEENWTIVKWVALGIVVLEAFIFWLALMVRAANIPADYDSDDDFIARREQRQPLISRPPSVPASGVPVSVSLDQRPSRNDAWSARMREKYGLDTSEFTYNPAESNRYQQVVPPPAEERSRCTIM